MWTETAGLLVYFWGADIAGFGERVLDGEIVLRDCSFSDRMDQPIELEGVTRQDISDVLETGFLSSRVVSLSQENLSLSFLPVAQENKITRVLVVGHTMSKPLSKDLLNSYLAVTGLVSATAARLASEAEVREHRYRLEGLVQERTAQLKIANADLQEEIAERLRVNRFLRNVLESLTYPFFVINPNDYTIELANSAAVTHGLTPNSTCYSVIFGRNETCLDSGNPCPLEKVKKTKRHVVVEQVHVEKDGARRDLEVHAYPVLDDDGNIQQVIEYLLDITDRKVAEQERENLLYQLSQAQKMEALATLTGGIAHDFNNLLTIINGYTEVILSEKTEDDPLYSDLERILETGRKGAELVRKLLTLSKKTESNPKPVELNSVIEDSAAFMERTFPQNDRN